MQSPSWVAQRKRSFYQGTYYTFMPATKSQSISSWALAMLLQKRATMRNQWMLPLCVGLLLLSPGNAHAARILTFTPAGWTTISFGDSLYAEGDIEGQTSSDFPDTITGYYDVTSLSLISQSGPDPAFPYSVYVYRPAEIHVALTLTKNGVVTDGTFVAPILSSGPLDVIGGFEQGIAWIFDEREGLVPGGDPGGDPGVWAVGNHLLGPGLFSDEIAAALGIATKSRGGDMAIYIEGVKEPYGSSERVGHNRAFISVVVPEPPIGVLTVLGGVLLLAARYKRFRNGYLE